MLSKVNIRNIKHNHINHIYWVASKDGSVIYKCKLLTIQYETQLNLPDGRNWSPEYENWEKVNDEWKAIGKTGKSKSPSVHTRNVIEEHIFKIIPSNTEFTYNVKDYGNIYQELKTSSSSTRKSHKKAK
jgi:hypothetical protein